MTFVCIRLNSKLGLKRHTAIVNGSTQTRTQTLACVVQTPTKGKYAPEASQRGQEAAGQSSS